MGRRKPQTRRISGAAKRERRREEKKSSNLLDEKRRLKSEKTVISTNKSFGGQNLDILLPRVDNNTLSGPNQSIGTKRKREENKPIDSSMRRERTRGEKRRSSLDSRSDKNYEGGGSSKRSSATCETRSESDGVKNSESRKRRKRREHEENKPVDRSMRRERTGGEKRRSSLDSRSDKNYEGGGSSKHSSATCETRSESDGVKNNESRKWRRHRKKSEHEENKPIDSSMRRERTSGEKRRSSLDSRFDKSYEGGSSSKRSSATCETRSESDGVKNSESRKRTRHRKRREVSDASPCKVIPEKVGKSVVESLGSNSSGIVESSAVPSAIRCCARKKLLVLDLNGLLCDVVHGNPDTRKPHKRVGKSAVFKRPFCDEFMKFCCEKFDIGVWSSRKMENVHGVVNFIMRDIKDTLLFCWDASKCTYTGYKTIEDRHKPLVLKQLKKIWNKEGSDLPWEKGDYSPSNTLLIDDSPYKALCNPPYTGIFPYPYSYKDDNDNSLGPGGGLRVYLEGLALADDVQCYIREHPFGRHAITTTHPSWKYYERVVEMINRSSGKAQCT